MKRVLLIILLHLSLFFIVFAYQAQAEEDGWSVHDFKEYTYYCPRASLASSTE